VPHHLPPGVTSPVPLCQSAEVADRKVDTDLATGLDPAGPLPSDPRYDDRYADGRKQVKVPTVRLAKVRSARGATR
jgi:hypothetical protein